MKHTPLSVFGICLSLLAFVIISMTYHTPIKKEPWVRPEIIFPSDNPISDASINLGGALFFETLLSKDSTLSCEGCHMMNNAMADHLPLGEGIKNRHVTRNTPTVFNMAFQPYFMADGKFESLEDQVLGPINEHREFDMSPEEVVSRLKTEETYNQWSQEAYQSELTIEVVQKAIANYERFLISDNSRFDQYQRGEVELTLDELHGWELFKSEELNCVQCHNGYNFSNYSFENNGLYVNYADSGRALITKEVEDLAKFKVPSLRNIAITYPYMHNGSVGTLEEVIKHYASGGKEHRSKSRFIKGFELNEKETQALIAFLNTLTDQKFIE